MLYPNNTENEMNDIFKPCKPFSNLDFYTKQYNKVDSVYKNPKYSNIIFSISNNFLFYNNYTLNRDGSSSLVHPQRSMFDSRTRVLAENTPTNGSSADIGERRSSERAEAFEYYPEMVHHRRIIDTASDIGNLSHLEKSTPDIYDIVSKKYQFLKKYLNNQFKNIDSEVIDIFRIVQKHYNAFARFAHIWRYKMSKIQIDHDLYMTPLSRNSVNVFSLLQQGNIYLFTASNLVSSINASLMNASNFFVEPLVLKNPYTNVPFKKSNLYNIYFFLKQSPIIMPILFHSYFLTDFNLRLFRDENENMIRTMYIRSVIRNSTPDTIHVIIERMLKKYQPKIIIDKDFPKDILANIMKPYVELYYIIKYSTEEYRVIDAKENLLYKLTRLYKYNPAFGRKIVRLKREGFSKTMKKHIIFNDNHIQFDEPTDTEMYKKSHLELIEANYVLHSDDNTESEIDHSANESENISEDTPQYGNYIIISPNPTFYMTDNLFAIVTNPPEYTESENTNEDETESQNDEQEEVVIVDSSQDDEDSDIHSDESDEDEAI
jgi:hypothetical protein